MERCVNHSLSLVSICRFVSHLTYVVCLGVVYLLIQSWDTPQAAVWRLKTHIHSVGSGLHGCMLTFFFLESIGLLPLKLLGQFH